MSLHSGHSAEGIHIPVLHTLRLFCNNLMKYKMYVDWLIYANPPPV